jgi:hypothetical protein
MEIALCFLFCMASNLANLANLANKISKSPHHGMLFFY